MQVQPSEHTGGRVLHAPPRPAAPPAAGCSHLLHHLAHSLLAEHGLLVGQPAGAGVFAAPHALPVLVELLEVGPARDPQAIRSRAGTAANRGLRSGGWDPQEGLSTRAPVRRCMMGRRAGAGRPALPPSQHQQAGRGVTYSYSVNVSPVKRTTHTSVSPWRPGGNASCRACSPSSLLGILGELRVVHHAVGF